MPNSCPHQDNVIFDAPQKGHGPKKGRRLSDSQMSSHRPTTDAYPRRFRQPASRKGWSLAGTRFAVNRGVNSYPSSELAAGEFRRGLLFNAEQFLNPT